MIQMTLMAEFGELSIIEFDSMRMSNIASI